MNNSAIRHLAASYGGNKFAAAEFEKTVSVWDLDRNQKVSQFDTIIDFGGNRLAISEDGNIVAAGAYRAKGVAAYNTSNGSLLWQRKELTKVQSLLFDPWDGCLLACFDDAPCISLDVQTGSTIRKIGGQKKITVSPYHEEFVATENKTSVEIKDRKTLRSLFSIQKESFAILSLIFTPDSICISEPAVGLRCVDLKDKSLLWRFAPPQGKHFLNLAYSEKNKLGFGIMWAYEERGEKELYWFNPLTGEIVGRMEIAGLAAVTEFALKGNILITSDGDVYDLCSEIGPVVRTNVNFPLDKKDKKT
jgi:WD40 repeat protein